VWNRSGPPSKWIEEADWTAERATLAFQNRDLPEAQKLAERSVTLTRKIRKRDPTGGLWARQLADRLRTLAEIRQAAGDHGAAVTDADDAITAYRDCDTSRYPLFEPSLHLMLMESHAALGEREPAVRHGEAVEDYRRALDGANDHTEVLVARALAQYAAAMYAVGEVERADTAARESVAVFRPRIADIHLQQDLITFAQTVVQLVLHAESPDAGTAAELIPLLRDAIEQAARTVSESPLAYTTSVNRDHALAVLTMLEQQGRLLDALGAPRLAAVFEHRSHHFVDQPVRDWPAALARLREQTDAALELRTDPPELLEAAD
jgi:tetratricopeptide (TPR) repeat protein